MDQPKKCVSLSLSLMGCFGPIDSTSYTHPGSSMLSSNLTDCSFLPPRGLSCLSDSFSNFFFGFLMLSLSLPQLDASRSGKWMPTTVRQFLFAPVILLSYLFLSSFALEVSVLSSFNWKLCTAWFEKRTRSRGP